MGVRVNFKLGVCAFVTLALLQSSSFCQEKKESPYDSMSFKELIKELEVEKVKYKKKRIERSLKNKLPQTEEEKRLLVNLLDDKDDENKIISMNILGLMKEKSVVPKLLLYLKSKNPIIAMFAVVSLSQIGDERAVSPLLEDADLMVFEFGACPVAWMGVVALPQLIEIAKQNDSSLEEKNKKRRENVIYAISQIKDEKAVPLLIGLLKEKNDDLRAAAVRSLFAMKSKDAELEFVKLLDDPSVNIQSLVIKSLVNMDKGKYLEKLYDKTSVKNDELVRRTAIELLGELKDSNSVDILEKLLVDDNALIRFKASKSLWEIAGKAYKHKKGKFEVNEEEKIVEAFGLGIENGYSESRLEDMFNTARKQGYLLEYSFKVFLSEMKEIAGKQEKK